MLMALRYGLPPGDRGLVLSDDLPIWTFPEDYVDRLRAKLIGNRLVPLALARLGGEPR